MCIKFNKIVNFNTQSTIITTMVNRNTTQDRIGNTLEQQLTSYLTSTFDWSSDSITIERNSASANDIKAKYIIDHPEPADQKQIKEALYQTLVTDHYFDVRTIKITSITTTSTQITHHTSHINIKDPMKYILNQYDCVNRDDKTGSKISYHAKKYYMEEVAVAQRNDVIESHEGDYHNGTAIWIYEHPLEDKWVFEAGEGYYFIDFSKKKVLTEINAQLSKHQYGVLDVGAYFDLSSSTISRV